jgi:hypothetical protein
MEAEAIGARAARFGRLEFAGFIQSFLALSARFAAVLPPREGIFGGRRWTTSRPRPTEDGARSAPGRSTWQGKFTWQGRSELAR